MGKELIMSVKRKKFYYEFYYNETTRTFMLSKKRVTKNGMHEDILGRFPNDENARKEIENLVSKHKINSKKIENVLRLVS